MSWEEKTMRSKTSCFNFTMFRHDIRRYWPLWACCLFLMVLVLPVVRLYNHTDPSEELLRGVGWSLELAVNGLFSVLFATAVFSPLYGTKSSGFYGSLPVRREAWFLSSWLSGFTMLAGCGIVTALLMLGAELSCGDLAFSATLAWLVKYLLLALFFYGLSSLCALLTGTIWVAPLLYAVLNFAAWLIWAAVCQLCDMLTTGWVEPENIWLVWLTPLIRIAETDGVTELWVLIVYAAVGLLFSLEALRRMKKRRMEYAADIVAVKTLKPIFRWVCGVCGGLFLGVILYMIFLGEERGHIWQMMLFELPGVFIGWFAAEMLNRRSFRVWRKLPGFVLCALLVTGATWCCGHGCFGYEAYIPAEEDIVRVEFDDFSRGWGFSEDRGDIHDFTELHEYLRHRNAEYGQPANLVYVLKNGKTVCRCYYPEWEDYTVRERKLIERMEINGIRAVLEKLGDFDSFYAEWSVEGGIIELDRKSDELVRDLVLPALESGALSLYSGEADNCLTLRGYGGWSSFGGMYYRQYRFHASEPFAAELNALRAGK